MPDRGLHAMNSTDHHLKGTHIKNSRVRPNSALLIPLLFDMNYATAKVIIRRLVFNVPILIEFTYTSMVGCNTGNFRQPHKIPAEYTNRAFAIVFIPVLHNRHE